MDSRRRVAFGALAWAAMLLVRCAPRAPQAAELRLGEINSLSGVLAAQGTAVHEGVVTAVSEVNGRGGIRAHPVKLITRDDKGRPDEATNAARDLAVRQKVSVLVGGYVDSIVGPVGQVAEREGVPYVAILYSSTPGATQLARLRFDEHGEPLDYEAGIFQIQNGRHVLLYPRDRATGTVRISKRGPT